MPHRARAFVCAALLSLAMAMDADAASRTVHSISPPGMTAYEVSLATLGQRLAVAWHGGDSPHSAVWLRFVDEGGSPQGDVVKLTDGQDDAYEPDLQPFADGLAVAWYEKDPRDESLRAWLARLDSRGHELWRRSLSGSGHNGRNPVVRTDGRRLIVAWLEANGADAPSVRVARLDAAGQQLGDTMVVAEASRDTWNLNAALDSAGAFYVVYDAALGTRAKELQLVRIDRSGHTLRWQVSGDDGAASTYPDIAISHGRIAITWFDRRDGNDEVYLYVESVRRISAIDGNLDVVARGRRITHTAGASIGAYLAWNGSRLGLSWQDEEEGQATAWFASFDATGKPSGAQQRLDSGSGQSLIPAIRPWRRGFAVAWADYVPDTNEPHQPPRSSVAELTFVE